jgi:hypothetical protein
MKGDKKEKRRRKVAGKRKERERWQGREGGKRKVAGNKGKITVAGKRRERERWLGRRER